MTDNIKKHSFIATLAIMGSRIFGLVREQVFAFFFGASFAQDAFVAAFRIPNLMRDLFAEGALSQAFVTIFSQKLRDGNEKSYALANKVTTFVILVVGTLTVLGIIFSNEIVAIVATGFTGDKHELTVLLNRILFPFILFASLASIFMGMLNAKNKFFLPQSASTFFNITSIVVGLFTAFLLSPDYIVNIIQKKTFSGDPAGITKAILGMGVGTLTGGIVQWLIQYPSLRGLGYRFRLDFHFRDSELIRVLKLTGPAIIGGAAVQINVIVNTYFASYLYDGAVSYLNYAFRFMQFPLGVFGVAIAVASAPKLARLLSDQNVEGFKHTMRSSINFSLFLSLPSTVGLFLLSGPIISLIYEHGQFSANDALQTAYALMAYTFGIAFYSLIKIYQPAYLAFHDAKTPMMISLFSIFANFGINWYFVRVLQLPHWALALGVSCVAVINFSLLALFFQKKLKTLWEKEIFATLGKILVAILAMAISVLGTLQLCNRFSLQPGFLKQFVFVFFPIGIGSAVYFLMGIVLKLEEARFFLKKFKRS